MDNGGEFESVEIDEFCAEMWSRLLTDVRDNGLSNRTLASSAVAAMQQRANVVTVSGQDNNALSPPVPHINMCSQQVLKSSLQADHFSGVERLARPLLAQESMKAVAVLALHLASLNEVRAWGDEQSYDDWYKQTGDELDRSCNDEWCTSSDAGEGVDCFVERHTFYERATCHKGTPRYAGGGGYLSFRNGFPVYLFRYSCCTGSAGSNTDPNTWEKNFDATCSDAFCTSTDGMGGTDCFVYTENGAGAKPPMERCSCSRGTARLSTAPFVSMRSISPFDAYKYSCCESGINDGDTCGFGTIDTPPALMEEAAPASAFSQSSLLGVLGVVGVGGVVGMIVAVKRFMRQSVRMM